MQVEHDLIGDMFEHLQNSLPDDPMMHFVPIAMQVLMIIEQFNKEDEMMRNKHLKLRLILMLEGNAADQDFNDGLCNLGGFTAGLPSNDDLQHIFDHPEQQIHAVVCRFLVEVGNGADEVIQAVRNVIDGLVRDVGGQESVDFVHDGHDSFLLLQLQIVEEKI